MDTREIAARLNVNAILSGSVRKSENRLRIVAQLVDATDGFQLWSETYERELEDVFAIQDEIARAIVRRLDRELPREAARQRVASTEDPEAYNLYLRGRYEWHKRTEQGLLNAATFLAQAVARAPEHARAHAGLGDAYAVLGFYDYLPPRDAFPRAKRAAQGALQLDPSLAEPHATLGYVALYHEWEWESAEEEFTRAIELNPSYSTGHQWYANFLTAMGRFDEAVREMRAAQDVDPLSLIANAALALSGDVTRARALLDRLVQRHAAEYVASYEIAKIYEALDDRGAALLWIRRAFHERSHSIAFLVVDPQLKRLRSDPQQELVRPPGSTDVPRRRAALVLDSACDGGTTPRPFDDPSRHQVIDRRAPVLQVPRRAAPAPGAAGVGRCSRDRSGGG